MQRTLRPYGRSADSSTSPRAECCPRSQLSISATAKLHNRRNQDSKAMFPCVRHPSPVIRQTSRTKEKRGWAVSIYLFIHKLCPHPYIHTRVRQNGPTAPYSDSIRQNSLGGRIHQAHRHMDTLTTHIRYKCTTYDGWRAHGDQCYVCPCLVDNSIDIPLHRTYIKWYVTICHLYMHIYATFCIYPLLALSP